MPNPTDTARALVEALEVAAVEYNDAVTYDSDRIIAKRDEILNTARAALLAHVAGVEKERDQYKEMYEQWITWARTAEARCYPEQTAEDSYGMQYIIMGRIAAMYPEATRPTEARDA